MDQEQPNHTRHRCRKVRHVRLIRGIVQTKCADIFVNCAEQPPPTNDLLVVNDFFVSGSKIAMAGGRSITDQLYCCVAVATAARRRGDGPDAHHHFGRHAQGHYHHGRSWS
jgi:hypothetical protein